MAETKTFRFSNHSARFLGDLHAFFVTEILDFDLSAIAEINIFTRSHHEIVLAKSGLGEKFRLAARFWEAVPNRRAKLADRFHVLLNPFQAFKGELIGSNTPSP